MEQTLILYNYIYIPALQIQRHVRLSSSFVRGKDEVHQAIKPARTYDAVKVRAVREEAAIFIGGLGEASLRMIWGQGQKEGYAGQMLEKKEQT